MKQWNIYCAQFLVSGWRWLKHECIWSFSSFVLLLCCRPAEQKWSRHPWPWRLSDWKSLMPSKRPGESLHTASTFAGPSSTMTLWNYNRHYSPHYHRLSRYIEFSAVSKTLIQFPGLFGILKFHSLIPSFILQDPMIWTGGTRVTLPKAEAKAMKEAAPDPNKKEAKVTWQRLVRIRTTPTHWSKESPSQTLYRIWTRLGVVPSTWTLFTLADVYTCYLQLYDMHHEHGPSAQRIFVNMVV